MAHRAVVAEVEVAPAVAVVAAGVAVAAVVARL